MALGFGFRAFPATDDRPDEVADVAALVVVDVGPVVELVGIGASKVQVKLADFCWVDTMSATPGVASDRSNVM